MNAGRLGKGVFDFSGDFVGALQGSGVWELAGDKLTLTVSQTNIPSFKAEPWVNHILEASDTKLILQGEKEKLILFRTPPAAEPARPARPR